MKKMQADRQGDVTLVHTEGMNPKELLAKYQAFIVPRDRRGRVVLAEGEVTGHAHAFGEDNITLLRPPELPSGHAWLVVTDEAVKKGDFLEGKVIETLPNGMIRFRREDGKIIKFAPSDVEMKGSLGVKVLRPFSLLAHEEHDGIPVSRGVFKVIQHQTADHTQRRRIVED